MIAGQNLDALPQFLTQSIRLVRMRKDLTVQPAFQTRELQTQCPEHVTVCTFNHLKFFEALLQICRR